MSAFGSKADIVSDLQTQAVMQPAPFLGLLGKVLPLQIAGDPENPIKQVTEIRETFVRPKDRDS